MSTKRKSAFSVYAETKPEPKLDEIQSKLIDTTNTKKSGNKKISPQDNLKKSKPNGKQIKNNNHKQAPVVIKTQEPLHKHSGGVNKRKSNVKEDKKIRTKYSKLTNEKLIESINLFNANKKNVKPAFAQERKVILLPEGIRNPASSYNRVHSTPSQKPSTSNGQNEKKLKPLVESKSEREADELVDAQLDEQEIFDSRKEAMELFKKIIYPLPLKEFFSSYWEKKPLLIKREDLNYNSKWFSCKELDSILRNNTLDFTQNIDVTTYIDGVKQNHNLEGRAFAPLVWDFFQQGCSIRFLNPQTYSKNCWQYLSLLQELFGTCVGANTYLTPQGTQGFAPHYDDIEAFVLQLEGKKRWRVYKPLFKEEVLPRFSSGNYEQSQLEAPIIDVVLEAGDLLYFPRGYIHQANACDDIHSLHITVSCYQKNSWGDFLTKLLPGAIEIAMQENVEFRKGLPLNYLIHNGIAFESDKITKDRQLFVDKTASLIKKLIKYAPIDSAVDQMAKQFIHDSLPPCLNASEKSRSIHGHGEKWNEAKNRVDNISEIEPDTAIKLIRRNCLRLVVEDNNCLVYHNLENGKIYREKEPQYLEVETEAAPAIEFLIKKYPNYVTVEDLPLKTMEEKIVVASCLYDKGLLVTGEPLESNNSDEEDEDLDEDDDDDQETGDDDDNDDEEELEHVDESNADLVDSIDNGEEFSDEDKEDDDDFNSIDYDKNGEEGEQNNQNEEDSSSD